MNCERVFRIAVARCRYTKTVPLEDTFVTTYTEHGCSVHLFRYVGYSEVYCGFNGTTKLANNPMSKFLSGMGHSRCSL